MGKYVLFRYSCVGFQKFRVILQWRYRKPVLPCLAKWRNPQLLRWRRHCPFSLSRSRFKGSKAQFLARSPLRLLLTQRVLQVVLLLWVIRGAEARPLRWLLIFLSLWAGGLAWLSCVSVSWGSACWRCTIIMGWTLGNFKGYSLDFCSRFAWVAIWLPCRTLSSFHPITYLLYYQKDSCWLLPTPLWGRRWANHRPIIWLTARCS